MEELRTDLRCILIGGSSNVGKTTLAEQIASSLGWQRISTDQLARHPGRPWKVGSTEVPEHVADHYLSLNLDELLADVLRHYRGMWSGIASIIDSHIADRASECLVLEGSALWPETVASLETNHVAAIWLTASDDLFQQRIYDASLFDQCGVRDQAMIQKFLERTCSYNERMLRVVKHLNLAWIDVETASSREELLAMCIAQLNARSSENFQ